MTARLSPLQRQVLEQLAHIRVAPEDAVLSTDRLAQLVERFPSRVLLSVRSLWERGLVDQEWRELPPGPVWRITDKGREALG